MLDEVVFQQEGIRFAGHYHIAQVVDVFDQHVGFGVVVYLVEVGGYAFLQVFGFAYVDDFIVRIEVLVHARFVGKCVYLLFQSFALLHMTLFCST